MKRRIVSAAPLSLVLASAGTAPAIAAQKNVKATAGPNDQIIAGLRSVIGVLKQADHDYKGHRVNAIKATHTAIKALETTKANHKHPKIAPGTGTVPQAVSDGMLAKAKASLGTILAGLQSSPGGAGNRATAITSIQTAMTEIDTALKIK